MLRLKTLGQPLVERDGAPLGGAARQRRVLALLALLAAGRDRGVSRDRVLALLWPEREPEKARQALTQSLYHARKALGENDLFIGSADLRLNPDVISTDIGEFEDTLAAGDRARAVELYQGAFLDGFHVSGAAEFERWASDERERLRARCARALEELATAASDRSDDATAVVWRKRLAAMDPLNSRIALDLMRAMAAAGDRAGAIRHAQIHESLLRAELDASPNPAITELAEALRNTSTWIPDPGGARRADPPPPAHGSGTVRAATPLVVTASPHEVGDTGWPSDPDADVVSVERAPRFLSGRGPHARWAAALAALVLVAVAVAVAMSRIAPGRGERARDMLVVAPFRVSGADETLGYLREGLVDLLAAVFGDDRGGVADPSAVMSAWRRAGLTDRTDVARDRALETAGKLGGTRLLVGSVVGTPSRLVVTAAVLTVPGGEVRAQASADGPADSLMTIVDRLAARLLAKEAGEWDRLANHLSESPEALRAYLDGQAAYRRGSYRNAVRDFRRALERDPAFATAALALANAADRIDASEDRAHGLAVAWAGRGRLAERDDLYLIAMAGPRYPGTSSPREHLTAWERASALAPDRADVWHELGEHLFFDGQALGLRDWTARAAAAFRRAAELDASFASPLQYLVQLAAARHDTAAVRAAADAYVRLDSIGELAPFVRWRAAVALDDREWLVTLRQRFTSMPVASLRAIALSSQYNGVATADAERAVAALASRTARGTDRADLLLARHALALNRGDPAAAADAAVALADDRIQLPRALRLRVLDYLYGGGDSTAAARAVSRLARRLPVGSASAEDAAPRAARRTLPTSASDACVVGQWHAWTIPVPRLDTAVALPVRGVVELSATTDSLCTALVDAIAATRSTAPDATRRVARLDSLLVARGALDESRDYAGLALARVYEAAGDPSRALAAVRRRPYMRGWPHYLAAHLREEGRLATLTGDTASATQAYRHYLTLRSAPEGDARLEVDTVRAELARLTR